MISGTGQKNTKVTVTSLGPPVERPIAPQTPLEEEMLSLRNNISNLDGALSCLETRLRAVLIEGPPGGQKNETSASPPLPAPHLHELRTLNDTLSSLNYVLSTILARLVL